MNYFQYQDGQLYAENIPVAELAKQYGTPCYIYSRAALEQQWQTFDQAFINYPHRICYAVKANSNLAILNLLARLGSGFDIVSLGELERVLTAGGNPKNIVFSGIGKQIEEIQRALELEIFCFNIESAAELSRLNTIATQLNKRAPITLRVNPDIDSGSHPYISTGLKENKFGIAIEEATTLYHQAINLPHLEVRGIACHIGSQLTDLAPFLATLDRLLALIDELAEQGIKLQHLNLGGGLGVCYHDETPPTFQEYGKAILEKLKNRAINLILEPGRAIVANAGILVTRVEYLKHSAAKNFAIVDAAMNDLLRPALYNAWHGIIPVIPRTTGIEQLYDVVGPICETGDFLGKTRHLRIIEGDLLAICSAGAYGFSMSSNYNSRPRVAEIMVDRDQAYLIRQREEITELFSHEKILPEGCF